MQQDTGKWIGAVTAALLVTSAFAQEAHDAQNEFDASVPYDRYLDSEDLRASELLGATVRNQEDEELGSIDELIVSRDDDVITAVISVGGFLGIGDKKVGVPYEQLRVSNDGSRFYLSATQEELESRPDFYSQQGDEDRDAAASQSRRDAAQSQAAQRGSEASADDERAAARRQGGASEQARAGSADEDIETMGRAAHRASNLIGLNVVDSQGEDVGEIDDLIVSENQELIAVIAVGGVLGVGESLIAVPLDELSIENEDAAGQDGGAEVARVRIDSTAEQLLDSEPEFRYELSARLERQQNDREQR